jgi:hypothetical protein
LIAAYAEGRALEAERGMVEEHLVACDGCRRQVAAVAEAAGMDLEHAGIREKASVIPFRRAVPAAAAVLLVGALLWAFWPRGDQAPAGTERVLAGDDLLADVARRLSQSRPDLFEGYRALAATDRKLAPIDQVRSGGSLTLLSPRGKVAARPTELRWRAVPGTDRYGLEIFDLQDSEGRPLFVMEATAVVSPDGIVAVPIPPRDPELPPGHRLLWKVVAHPPSGNVEGSASFEIAPAAEAKALEEALGVIDREAPIAARVLTKAHYAIRKGFVETARGILEKRLAEDPGDVLASETLSRAVELLALPRDEARSRPR